MANLLAKVGRDPKTCTAQLSAFCRGGIITGVSGGAPGSDKRQQRRNVRAAGGDGDGDVSNDDGEDRSEGKKHRRGGRRAGSGHTDGGGHSSSEDAGKSAGVGRRNRGRRVEFAAPSTASLAEIIAFFGFVFEGTGAAVKPSVAEAFAMLRLHAQPAEARAAGEAARRCTFPKGAQIITSCSPYYCVWSSPGLFVVAGCFFVNISP